MIQVSRLMLRPKRPYRAFLSSPISSWMPSSFVLSESTSASSVSVDEPRSSRTWGCGNDTKQSPILYLFNVSKPVRHKLQHKMIVASNMGRLLTVLSLPHPRVRVRQRFLQDPPSPSVYVYTFVSGASQKIWQGDTNSDFVSRTIFARSSSSSISSFWCRELNRLIFS